MPTTVRVSLLHLFALCCGYVSISQLAESATKHSSLLVLGFLGADAWLSAAFAEPSPWVVVLPGRFSAVGCARGTLEMLSIAAASSPVAAIFLWLAVASHMINYFT